MRLRSVALALALTLGATGAVSATPLAQSASAITDDPVVQFVGYGWGHHHGWRHHHWRRHHGWGPNHHWRRHHGWGHHHHHWRGHHGWGHHRW
jgi:hypothetical protein